MVRLLSIALLAASAAAAQNTEMRGIRTHYELKPYASKAQWEARRAVLQKRILSSAGLDPMPPKTPLQPRYVKQVTTDMAVVDTILLETLPGFLVGANLYKPRKLTASMPAVIVPHGHWANGRVENLPEYSVPALAMNLARQGYVVLTLDMVGYNDTNQHEHKFGSREEEMWSYTALGLQLWNSIRAVDFLESLAEVDRQRIAATGASGGGTQTFLLAAVDDRVKYVAPVNMISAYMQGGCTCEGAPGLRVNTFNVELAAIAAPRPMLMVSCTGDWTSHTREEEFPAMQRMYELFDAKTRVENSHIDAKHNYNADSRSAVYRFFAKYMQPSLSEAELAELPIPDFRPSELLAGAVLEKPAAAQLFADWKIMSRRQTLATGSLDTLRERLQRVFHLGETPSPRPQWLWKPGKGDPLLVVYSERSQASSDLFKTDRPLLILSAYRHVRVEEAAADRSYHTYNLSEGALQVRDILAALDEIEGEGTVEIVPVGNMLMPSIFAAALSPRAVRVTAPSLPKAGEEIGSTFFVPGIERAGGIDAALRLLKKKGSR